MASVTFSAGVGGNGSTVTDDSSATTGLGNGGHRTRFVPALAQTVAVAANVVANATAAAASAASAVNAPGTSATSATSLTIASSGFISLTLAQTGKAFSVGQSIVLAMTATPTNWMAGVITAFTSATGAMTVSRALASGSGTASAWTVSLTSPVLADGTVTPDKLSTGAPVWDTSGNVGLGATPSVWSSAFKAIEAISNLSMISSAWVGLGVNAYRGDTGWKYKSNGYAYHYAVAGTGNGSGYQWNIAAPGTADAPITFMQAMTLDASGNLGLGVTPSAWAGSQSNLQIAGSKNIVFDDQYGSFGTNYYYASSAYRYIKSSQSAARYSHFGGVHQWFNAPPGTAGNPIAFTQAMTLDASGNLGLGVTAPATRLDVLGQLRLQNDLNCGPVFNLNWLNNGGARQSYKIATLPVSSAGTYDHIVISGVVDSGWSGSTKARIELLVSNRGGLAVKYLLGPQTGYPAHIDFYTEADGSASIWVVLDAMSYATVSLNIEEAFGVTVYPTPGNGTPTGTIVTGTHAMLPITMVDPSGAVTFSGGSTTQSNGDNSTKLATTAYVQNMGLGWGGQVWQDVTVIRASGTVYTNTTGRPIQVIVTFPDTSGGTPLATIVVGGVTILSVNYDSGGGYGVSNPSFIVPNNTTYSVSATGGGSISRWAELR